MMGVFLLAWSQVFTFPARDVARLQVAWAVGDVEIRHREDTLIRVEIHKADTLAHRVVIGRDTFPLTVHLDEGVLSIRMKGELRESQSILDVVRSVFSWIFSGQRPHLRGKDSLRLVITGPIPPYDITVNAGDVDLQAPVSGSLTVNVGNATVVASDTADLNVSIHVGDVTLRKARTLSLEVNVGDATVEEVIRAEVSMDVGDLVARAVDSLSLDLNVGDVQAAEVRWLQGKVDVGDVHVAYHGQRPDVAVETPTGDVHIKEEAP